MTLKIETASDGRTTTIRLIGRIEAAHLADVQEELGLHRPRALLDLNEVTLVDAAVVRFLIACEDKGIELRHCPPYIGEWIARERSRG